MSDQPENEQVVATVMTFRSLFVTCPACDDWFNLKNKDLSELRDGSIIEDVTCPECEHKFDVQVEEG